MPFIKWKTSISVGNDLIDEQHKTLIKIINDLYEAIYAGERNEVMEDILKRLIEYTQFHFSTEESMMNETDYPERFIHQAEHIKLTQQVEKYAADLHAGKILFSMEILGFLREWLNTHILKTDKKFGKFLLEL